MQNTNSLDVSHRAAVASGLYQQTNNGRGTNFKGSADVISNGSKIFVPENTAAFIFSQAGIEDVITQSGGYEYRWPAEHLQRWRHQGLDREADGRPLWLRWADLGSEVPRLHQPALLWADLDLLAFGTFSLRVVDAAAFVRKFLPANTRHYAFDSAEARQQISSEFMQAFIVAVNSLSATHRISELPSQAGAVAELIADDSSALGSWIKRYGLDVVQVGIESIAFSRPSDANWSRSTRRTR